jgi:hypothetical protein
MPHHAPNEQMEFSVGRGSGDCRRKKGAYAACAHDPDGVYGTRDRDDGTQQRGLASTPTAHRSQIAVLDRARTILMLPAWASAGVGETSDMLAVRPGLVRTM